MSRSEGQQLAANSLPVVLASDQTAVPISVAAAAASIAKAEDAAHTSGDTGAFILVVRQDTMAALAGTTGDYIPPTTDDKGQLRILAGAPDKTVTVTPTLDTSAYASGDLLFDSTEIANAVRVNGGSAIIQSITIEDKDDQTAYAFTLVFADAATDFGTLNSAPDPDDTEGETVLGCVAVAATDAVDFGAFKIYTVKNVGLEVQAAAGTTSLWVAAINGSSTPTHTASGMKIKVALLPA